MTDHAGRVDLHPCPICGAPAVGGPRYPRAVCPDCANRAVDRAGRRVYGLNTSMSGGFEARHDDDDGVCAEVTASGRCTIDGRLCSIGEARFGGVVVETG